MKRYSQKITIVFLVSAIALTSFAFLSPEKKEGVLAQEEGFLVCREPISIGSSLDATLEAMDVLVKETLNIHRQVSTQIETANAALTVIGKDAANCDTSDKVCKAMCPNIEVKVMFEVTLFWFIKLLRYPTCYPQCAKEESCLGKPCPSLKKDKDGEDSVLIINDSFDNLIKSIQRINDVFSSSTEIIEEDIIKEEEIAQVNNCLKISIDWFKVKDCLQKLEINEGAIDRYYECKNKGDEPEDCRLELYAGLKGLSKIEFAQRKLERTRADFHRWRMSPDDWEKVYRGEIIPRTAMKCLIALEERIYWPKWWTEDCEQYCKTDPYHVDCQDCLCTGCESTWGNDRCTDTSGIFGVNASSTACQECLDQSPIHQYSWLKATGCKFYGACKIKCQDLSSVELLEGCLTCLCEGLPAADECVQQHGGGDACDDECEKECKVVACQKWICGRSMLNWTSCLSY